MKDLSCDYSDFYGVEENELYRNHYDEVVVMDDIFYGTCIFFEEMDDIFYGDCTFFEEMVDIFYGACTFFEEDLGKSY